MFDLFRIELYRVWVVAKRYPMELVSGIGLMILAFYALFIGATYVSGPAAQFGEKLDALILGYCLWSFVLYSVNGIALGLQTEALTGTLEQIYLSPFGAVRVLLVRSIASLGIQLGIISLMLMILLALTGRTMTISPVLVLPLLTIFLGAYGIGLIMAALALVLKRVGQFLVVVQFVLLFLVAAPIEDHVGTSYLASCLLPVAPGAVMLRELLVRAQPLNVQYFLLALASGTGYLLVGTAVFRAAERQARKRGLLSQY